MQQTIISTPEWFDFGARLDHSTKWNEWIIRFWNTKGAGRIGFKFVRGMAPIQNDHIVIDWQWDKE
jgi:hypothetical protein